MIYQPFLISNYATGLDREVQPWLLPNDAFVDLLDGFVYRGVTKKRDGYSGFAIGLKSTYTESRMVHQVANVAPATGAIDGANKTFTWTLTTPIVTGKRYGRWLSSLGWLIIFSVLKSFLENSDSTSSRP